MMRPFRNLKKFVYWIIGIAYVLTILLFVATVVYGMIG